MASIKPKPISISLQDTERFLGHIQLGDIDECWPWKSSTTRGGYGQFFTKRPEHLSIRAHRIAYYLHTGEDPGDLLVLHKCDNPPCVNPHHLFVGTGKDNVQDMINKGRGPSRETRSTLMKEHAARGQQNGSHTRPDRRPRGDRNRAHIHKDKMLRGSAHPGSKLTEENVREIRRIYSHGGISMKKLGARFGVNATLVFYIIHRQIWSHVQDEPLTLRHQNNVPHTAVINPALALSYEEEPESPDMTSVAQGSQD